MISEDMLKQVALSREEYELIIQRLGREPNELELGMIGSLWSEHCGYKHSKLLLKQLPGRSRQVLTNVGEENAGAVDIGDGLAAVMKMESHNHPSAIEPFQGAATGIGGIVRDIFTMGARPIALLNSLRFGPLSESRNKYLFNGVVSGIAWYGNCLGIPNVGGEISFSPAYTHNPLVNVMCVGITSKEKLVKARASGPGNLLILIGADTGRDGLHGASGLASRTFEEEEELRSAVQVGNPFLEKVLLEACLELAGTDWIVGMQDLGAAGLTSAAIEAAGRAGTGVEIDVLKVPRREKGMTPYEVMLSESQERMLIIGRRGFEERIREVLAKYDLEMSVIGEVRGDGVARIREGERIVAELPVEILVTPPLYRHKVRKTGKIYDRQRFDPEGISDISPKDVPEVLLKLLSSPNIASKEWVYRQYDHQVLTNTVVPPGEDAAVLRIKGTRKGIALTTDGNGRWAYLDPFVGGAASVAEAARNIVCCGAVPLALTDCLNLGDPDRPEIYYELARVIQGIGHACRVLGIPVVSGNVSLYNETRGEAVWPTPVIGMLGLLEDISLLRHPEFGEDGALVVLLGEDLQEVGSEGLAGSEYLFLLRSEVRGRPRIDLRLERRVQRCVMRGIREGLILSAHDCSEGGLLVALAECAILGGRGFKGSIEFEGRYDAALFGERPSRVVVTVRPRDLGRLEELASSLQVPLRVLGTAGGDKFEISGLVSLPLRTLEEAWRTGLERHLTQI